MRRDKINPIIRMDFPDPDVIRVGDTYYMVSTTMHFMPGGIILRSFDLIHWEIATHIYEKLDGTKGQRLCGEENIYGQGMWAPSMRWHNGRFYVCFSANDTHRTYLYTAEQIEGPWEKQYIEGFYHDCSLLFDEGRVYIIYGNTDIWITELTEDLSGPKPDGLNRIIISEQGERLLGYEGSHIYKIYDKYYVFLIHSPGRKWFRTQACFVADCLEGDFTGGDIWQDDIGYCNQGVAQGGIVDTPEGEWYAVLFQDRGASGRMPVLLPVTWKDDVPVLGEADPNCTGVQVECSRLDYEYEPLYRSDDFKYNDRNKIPCLHPVWEFNHEPDPCLWSITERPGAYRIKIGKISTRLEEAVNTLTQRLVYPGCEIMVTVDGHLLKEGDCAGLCALQGCFGYIALKKETDGMKLVMVGAEAEDQTLAAKKNRDPGREYARVAIDANTVTLKMQVQFEQMLDQAVFSYYEEGKWKRLGISHKLYFKMDHFTGCRAGLFAFGTKQIGGTADFMNFKYAETEGSGRGYGNNL